MNKALDAIAAALEIDPAAVAPAELHLPRGFRLDAEGLWYEPRDKDGEAQSAQWICGGFEVLGLARDGSGEGWAIVLEFLDKDQRRKREILEYAELAGDGVEVRRRLLSRGLTIAAHPNARQRLQTALLGLNTAARVRLERSTGWKDAAYVLPHRTIGAPIREPVLFQGRAAGSYHGEAGSLEGWRAEVAAPMRGNAAGLFAVSVALAAPLLRELGAEGGGFHLRGQSSRGKSTLQRIAGSVWGGGGEIGFSHLWRHTDNALDALAVAHNDCLLSLDEIKVVGPEAAATAVYALATGIMKGRLRPDGDSRERPTWRVLILSSGEMGLADLIRQSKGRDRAYAGQELRLQDIAVDLHPEQGVWERLPQEEQGKAAAAAFSSRLKEATNAHYGWAGPRFVERYLQDRAAHRERAAALRSAFLARVLLPEDTGQIRRGAERFGLVAAAGELATELGVVPWRRGEVLAGVERIFQRWAAGFGRSEQHEDREALIRLRDFLQRYGRTRFALRSTRKAAEDAMYDEALGRPPKPREGEARSLDPAGWRDDDEAAAIFHIYPSVWLEIFAGMDPTAAARAVKAAGYLVSNAKGGRLQNRVSIGGSKESFYSVAATIMALDTEFTPAEAGAPVSAEVRTAKAEPDQDTYGNGSQGSHGSHRFSEDAAGDWEERAAVLEHDAGLSRAEAERRARRELTRGDGEP